MYIKFVNALRNNDMLAISLMTETMKHNSTLDVRDGKGQTPLAHAVAHSHLFAVELLLEHGADPNVVDRDGHTCLVRAIYSSELGLEMMKRLISSGANVNMKLKDYSDTTILFLACEGHFGSHVDLLLIEGADPNAVSSEGSTALMRACRYGYASIAGKLIGAGACLDTRDDYGMTALMAAADYGHSKCVSLLLDSGADPSIVSAAGKKAINYTDHPKVLELLTKE